MSREDAIKVEGAIVEAFSHRLYRVELPNGHRLMAHLPRAAGGSGGRNAQSAQPAMLSVGDRVTVELSPFDFSKGRLVADGK